ncbi:hypothetical protein [Lentzea sp. NPDC051838]|uniref:hypothetical protein n=1 Tax=Lentzea sp. NPDC051838 TaxID=3154849 RepID=UPI00343AE5A2
MTDVRAEVARLYEQHRKLRYPEGQRGMELAGVELILIDIYAADSAHSWLVHDDHARWLAPYCLDELRKVVPLFADPGSEWYRPYAAHYYGRLLRMMRLITLELAAEVVSP